MTEKKSTSALIILDGWGHREDLEDNAIKQAETPVWDQLWKNQPKTLISGSGLDVGLPPGQMGNSEVGHMNLGAGRVVNQDFTRITKAVEDGTFFNNNILTSAVDSAIQKGARVHILGLLSPGGVHSHEDHIKAAVTLAFKQGASAVYVHGFLDGRDVPPKSAEPSIKSMDAHIKEHGQGCVASIVGRYYAMDRDNRWDRVQLAYDMLTKGTDAYSSNNATTALAEAYARDESDEFVKPTVILEAGEPIVIKDNDTVLFMNFRADRAREITRAFVDKHFDDFPRAVIPDLSAYVMLTEYAADIDAPCAYPPVSLHNSFGEYLSSLGKTQLRLAETEKYAHVTFFFSGGQESPFPGETRKLIPSPKVATYDLKPEMSAEEVTDEFINAIKSGDYDTIICNFANGDMVGHTGDMAAAKLAVECIDLCLGRIIEALKSHDGQCLITADHGNCEKMMDHQTGQAHTAHTSELVPLIYFGQQQVTFEATGGTLSDVAPTLLTLMHLEQPAEMTGQSLIESDGSR